MAMDKVIGTPITPEDVRRITQDRNAPKQAALSSVASAVRLKAAVERMRDYLDSFEHAHETGNLLESQGCALSMTAAALTIYTAAQGVEMAVRAELDVTREAA
jgi:hypothetical protein